MWSPHPSSVAVFGLWLLVGVGQGYTGVRLALESKYGHAGFRDCRLELSAQDGQGRVRLECTLASLNPRKIEAERSLRAEEVREVTKLTEAADLYGGGHIGTDFRAFDREFETLTVRCCGRDVVILVTSGNPTFMLGIHRTQQSEARRQLLGLLHEIRKELQSIR